MAAPAAKVATIARPITARQALRAIPLAELLERPRSHYLIKGVLPRRGIGVMFGETGSAKTFTALDMVLAVGRGIPWRGHRVARAGVVYICAEGVSGFVDRVRAYLLHHHLTPDEPFAEVITATVNLLEPGDQIEELAASIKDAAERIGPIGVIVVDTLNRSMPGGDENSPDDMSAFVANVSRLAETVGAFALVVHHAGKDPARGARGHSSLKAAADVEIEIAMAEGVGRVLTITKSRDGESGARYGFRLEVVELGHDEDGDAITSCVVVPTDAPPPADRRGRELSGVARVALKAIQEALAEYGETMPATSSIPPNVRAVALDHWRTRFDLRYGSDGRERKAGSLTKAFNRGKEALLKANLVGISDPFAWKTGL